MLSALLCAVLFLDIKSKTKNKVELGSILFYSETSPYAKHTDVWPSEELRVYCKTKKNKSSEICLICHFIYYLVSVVSKI